MRKIILLLVFGIKSLIGYSQGSFHKEIDLPSILILPAKTEYKDIMNIDMPFNLKVGMATVNDAMKNFGFDTKDFKASYEKLKRDGKLDGCNACDLKELFFQEATADVMVELDFEYIETPDGNKVTVIVTAYHFSTSTSWASEVCESNRFYDAHVSELTKSAINMYNYQDEKGNDISYIENFMYEIMDYLGKCVEDGAIADIRITMDSDAGCDFNCKIEDKRLKYVLEDWVESFSYNNIYNLQSETDNQMIFDEVRYDCGKQPTIVGRKLTRFLDELGIEFNLSQSRSTVYVTLLNVTQ